MTIQYTTNFNLPYPQLTDTPNVPRDIQALATAVDGLSIALKTGNLSQFASTTSAQLLGIISDETGSGSLVFSTSPTLVTPILGVATATNLITNGAISGSSTSGAISYGTLSYSDTNKFLTLQTNVNSYAQLVLQNASSGTTASSDVVISNNLGTATTYYINLGMNSSGFTGSGSFNLPNAGYVSTTTGDLVLGTTTANAIRFVVNSGTSDAMTISSTGAITIGSTINGTTIPSTANLVTSADASVSIPTQTANSGKYLTTNGTSLSWATVAGGFTNPMTTAGDIIYGGTSGAPTRLAGSATNNFVLTYNTSTNAPFWALSSGYSTITLGSTALTSGATVTTVAGLTLTTPTINGATLSGTLSGAHTISGVATFSASPVISTITNTGTITLPTTTGTLALNNQAFFIGSTSITINQGTGTITALAGVTSVNGTTIPAASTLLTTTSTTSALTTVGTITSGTWSGSFGAVSGANLTSLTAANIAAGTLGSTVLPAAGATTTAGQIGYMGLPQNLNPGAYTLTAADNGKHIYYTTTGQTTTIPANGTLALPIGFSCVIVNAAAVTTSIAITTDTLILAGTGTTGTRTLAPYGMATLLKLTATSWTISGNGLT